MWCWRRLLRISWTAKRSNQSILKEINSEYSLGGLRLKLKPQYFDHLIRRTDSCFKDHLLPGSARKVTVRSHHLSKGCDCNINSHINMQVCESREWGVENSGMRHVATEHRVPKLTFSRSPASQTCRSCTQSMPKFISTVSNRDVHTRFVGLWWKLNSEMCIK